MVEDLLFHILPEKEEVLHLVGPINIGMAIGKFICAGTIVIGLLSEIERRQYDRKDT